MCNADDVMAVASAGGHTGPIDPRLAPRALSEPADDRLAADHPRRAEILAAHAAALAAGEQGYLDPETGRFVLTAARLVINGECCQSGCRHCPWLR